MAGIDIYKFDYPKELTDADWQKAKGKIGKLHKTGLGAELTRGEALFKSVDKTVLDPSSNPHKTYESLADAVKAAKAHYADKVLAVSKHMDKIIAAADAASAKLKKAVGGGSAAKAADAVKKMAEQFRVTCKSLDLETPIAKVKADIDKKNMLAAKLMKQSISKWATGAKAFLSDPTWQSWDSNVKQQGRSVSNSVAQLQEYRAQFWKDFEKFKGFDATTLGLSKDDPKLGDKMSKLVKLATVQVKAIAAFKP
ncbi:MAG: hypothetical protein WD046_13650 [Paracoccaceae bacterium]